MKKALKIIGITLGVVLALVLIVVTIMFFQARRNGMSIVEYLQSRSEARKAAQSQDITDTSKALVTGKNLIKLTSSGHTRTSELHIPSSYNPSTPTPLVIGYHGGFGEGENQENLTHMATTAEREGFIVAYPDGINRHWNDGRSKASSWSTTADDVQFTKDLIASISARLNIDKKRIYATGISNGGMMAYRVACEMTQTFAAIAPVSSAMPIEQKTLCHPTGSIPVLMIQGTGDPLIPFSGGQMAFKVGEAIPARETITYWINNNRTSTTPVVTALPNTDPNDGTTATKEVYGNGKDGSEVVFIQVNGGGHTWPGGHQYARERLIGKTSRDFNANDIIWEFFKQHSR